ncbi:Spore germination protein A3 [bioreactor metagenome]|uniref:Spore germination protein A3 n=1 Tax=bioreactor metagenome TaxID=1076179 RepID=A0A644WXJ9_9ZZZZ
MKKHIGRFFKTAICFLCITSLCGCWNSHELDTLGIVMGVALDKAEGTGGVQLTAQLVLPGALKSGSSSSGTGTGGGGGGSGGGSVSFWNVKSTGDTVFSAVRDVTDQCSRKLFFPHNQVLIFGKSLAQEGVQKYIDFFERDPETRNGVWVLVAKGSADEVLSVKPKLEKITASKIAEMVRGQQKATSEASAVTLSDFITRLMSKTAAPVATMIEVTGEGENQSLLITGTAVFKKDKLVGTLDKKEGRGLLWVLGEVKSGIIEVEGPDGSLVALETIRASGKMTAELKDGKIKMKITVIEEGNIGETTGTGDLNTTEILAKLEEKKAEAIRGEILAAFEKAKTLNADIFAFGEAVKQKYPNEFKTMEDNWDEVFKTIELELSVNAKLRLTGRINNPGVPQ